MFKNKFLIIPAVFLVFAMFFISCDSNVITDPPEQGGPGDFTPAARSPVFTLQPVSSNYTSGTPAPLTAQAEDPEGEAGTLTYQWYSVSTFANTGGTEIAGETEPAYQPTITGGEAFYYVVVTNPVNNKTARSNPVRISFTAGSANPDFAINVDLVQKQYVRGFGGMSNAFDITPGDIAKYVEPRDIDILFGHEPEQLGLNILRICLFPRPLKEIVANVHWGTYPWDNSTYFDIVKKVNDYGGYVLASPWYVPPEWNNNFTQTGGSLNKIFYGAYAKYLADWCREMSDNGAPVYAVAMANEPTLTGFCYWTAAEHRDFFKQNGKYTEGVPGWGGGKPLDSVLRMSGEPHSNVRWNNELLNDAQAAANVDIIGYHIYGTSDTRYALALDTHHKETWMTEYNINSGSAATYPNDSTWNYVWSFVNTVHHIIALNDSSAYIWWYSKRFYSFIGDDTYTTINRVIQPRGHAVSHYAKFATDTVRVGATHDSGNASFFVSAYLRQSRTAPVTEDKTIPMSKVQANEDSISLVFYDTRTEGGDSSVVRINLPEGWGEAKSVYGIVSDPEKRREPVLVVLNTDGKSADLTMTPNTIMSVKFTK